MAGDRQAWRVLADGLALTVRVTPKSSRDAIEGLEARGPVMALRVRVRAVPEDGKANVAVASLIAGWLDVPKRSVAVTGGLTARTKTVTLTGAAANIERALMTNLAALGPAP
jgi:uncharacterized protein